jgi:hypothetical protein
LLEIGKGNPRVKKLYPYPYPPKPLPPIKGRGGRGGRGGGTRGYGGYGIPPRVSLKGSHKPAHSVCGLGFMQF